MIERILITGFEPFGEHTTNVSGDALGGLDGASLSADGFEASTRVLPVQFERARDLLVEALEAHQPAAVIACGIHGEPGGPFRLEVMAKNERHYPLPDADGALVLDETVVPEGPPQVFSTLPMAPIKLALEASGLQVELSDDAGRYLSNAVFYWLVQQVPVAGFLRVPPDATSQDVQRAAILAAEATATRLVAQRVDALT
jgi:pyroglutamyl-peptidase